MLRFQPQSRVTLIFDLIFFLFLKMLKSNVTDELIEIVQ